MLNKSILFLILLCFLACEKSIDISKLTAIDGIQLGGKKSLFYNQCDSLNIKKSYFFTKDNFYNNENLDDYLLGTYYTEIFDFSQYRIGEMQHIGLINPFGLTATENIYGVRIFLGTTKFFHLKIINGKKYLKVATKVIKKNIIFKNYC